MEKDSPPVRGTELRAVERFGRDEAKRRSANVAKRRADYYRAIQL